jgi:hypothetical protein
MKNLSLLTGITELSSAELQTIEGGSFHRDLAHFFGMVARCIYEFGKAGGEFQSSLRANLKK